MDLSQDIFDCIRALSLLHNVQSFYFVIFVLFPLFMRVHFLGSFCLLRKEKKLGKADSSKFPETGESQVGDSEK